MSDGTSVPERRANESTLWSRSSNERNEAGAAINRSECARIYVALYDMPVVNQMEMYPLFQQTNLRRFMHRNGIGYMGYMALGSRNRPGRDRFKEHCADMQNPVIQEIAAEASITPP